MCLCCSACDVIFNWRRCFRTHMLAINDRRFFHISALLRLLESKVLKDRRAKDQLRNIEQCTVLNHRSPAKLELRRRNRIAKRRRRFFRDRHHHHLRNRKRSAERRWCFFRARRIRFGWHHPVVMLRLCSAVLHHQCGQPPGQGATCQSIFLTVHGRCRLRFRWWC